MPSRPLASVRVANIEATRERIVTVARDVVGEEGWQGAQIALIAARAGVATGSVYRYFESKTALYAQVLDMVSRQEVEVLREIVDGGGTAAERLATAITAFMRRSMKSRRLAYALIAEPCEPEIDAVRLKYRAVIAAQFARVIRDGMASGEFIDVDQKVAASCVVGAFVEALIGRLAPGAKASAAAAERMDAATVQLCTRMLAKAR